MGCIEVKLEQGSPEWHAWRRGGIGASEAPIIEGISPYRTARELAREKIDPTYEADLSGSEYIFAKGHQVEKVIRKDFQDLVGVEIVPVCFQNGIRLASLDGFHSSKGTLEAKLVGQDVLKKALEQAEIPDHHYSQMQHQFAVCGADVGQWFGHDGKKRGALVEVRRNDEYIKRLFEIEDAFWELVQRKELPPLTDRDYLEAGDDPILLELRSAKELAENAELAFKALKDEAVKKFGHSKISGAGLKLYRSERQGSIDILEIPEIASAIEPIRAKLDPSYVETFRKKSSSSWTVRIENRKAK